jgi:hypothetical protein
VDFLLVLLLGGTIGGWEICAVPRGTSRVPIFVADRKIIPDYVPCSAQFEQIADEISAVSLPQLHSDPSSLWCFAGHSQGLFFLT